MPCRWTQVTDTLIKNCWTGWMSAISAAVIGRGGAEQLFLLGRSWAIKVLLLSRWHRVILRDRRMECWLVFGARLFGQKTAPRTACPGQQWNKVQGPPPCEIKKSWKTWTSSFQHYFAVFVLRRYVTASMLYRKRYRFLYRGKQVFL